MKQAKYRIELDTPYKCWPFLPREYREFEYPDSIPELSPSKTRSRSTDLSSTVMGRIVKHNFHTKR